MTIVWRIRCYRHARRSGHTRREAIEYARNPAAWLSRSWGEV